MKKFMYLILITLLAFSLILTGCTEVKEETTPGDLGTLQFTANGEDFIRQGFTTKDGWNLTFEHVYITLSDITGYQTNPPYEPEKESEIKAVETVILDGIHTVDLAEGNEEADPILVGEVKDVPAGHYNAISWNMVKAQSGEFAGSSLVLIGEAEKDGQTVDFTIKLAPEFNYRGGEYIGDERKGFISETESLADLEMTFHFDHLFGDGTLPADDELNVGAFGFEPFATLSKDGKLDVDAVKLEEALSADQLQTLIKVFPNFGHVGEGHCFSKEL